MEILKSGRNGFYEECSRCGCVFAFDKTETHEVQMHMNEVVYAIDCPECHYPIFISYFKSRANYGKAAE